MMNQSLTTVPSGWNELDHVLDGGFVRPSNLIVAGPPLCGKKEFGMKMLGHGLEVGETALYISTSQTAEEVKNYWLNYGLRSEWEEKGKLKFIDCYSKMLDPQIGDNVSTRRIPSALDLTKLTSTVSELCTHFLLESKPPRLLFDSLSSLLVYSSIQTVMRFLHIFMGRLRQQNVLGFFLLEEDTHDQVTFNLLKTYSNGLIKMDMSHETLELEGFPRSMKETMSYQVTGTDFRLATKSA